MTIANVSLENMLDFEMASKRAVMVSKFVLLISEGKNY